MFSPGLESGNALIWVPNYLGSAIAGPGTTVGMCCYEMAGTRGGREAFFDLLADRAQAESGARVFGSTESHCASRSGKLSYCNCKRAR